MFSAFCFANQQLDENVRVNSKEITASRVSFCGANGKSGRKYDARWGMRNHECGQKCGQRSRNNDDRRRSSDTAPSRRPLLFSTSSGFGAFLFRTFIFYHHS
uniref:Secreted protein n=1 Tax=Steinernema glaseri TaxID=37863 RepID=A0A1I7Y5X6_9BILA